MKQTEIGMIPDDWEVKELKTIIEIKSKLVDPRKHEYWNLPHIGNENIEKYTGFLKPYKKVYEDNLISGKYSFSNTDVLYGKINPQFSKVAYPRFKGLCSADMYPLSCTTEIIPEYLKNSLLTKHFYDFSVSCSMRSGMPKINRKEIMAYKLALPTLSEQQKIAKALSDVDNVISTLEKLITKKKNLKQGTMQQLLTGKKRLPGFDPAVVESVETPATKQTEIGEIPEDWEVRELGEVAKNFTGLTYSPENTSEYGTLVLRSSNIQNDMLCFDDNVYVNMNIPERAIAHTGDILICVRNGSKRLIGKSALITESANNCAFGAFMTILRTELLNQQFLFYVWQSDLIQKQIEESMGATINQITNKDIRHYLIAYPKSNTEQTAIANVLSSMDKEIEALNTKLEKYRNLKTGMMQQLLTGKIRLV